MMFVLFFGLVDTAVPDCLWDENLFAPHVRACTFVLEVFERSVQLQPARAAATVVSVQIE
jgi:hypothetical protein